MVKKSTCNAGHPGSIPGSERSPGEGNCNPLQYSCLGNSVNRGAWRAIVHGVRHTGEVKQCLEFAFNIISKLSAIKFMYVIHKIFEYHAPNPIFALLYLFVVLFAHFLIELTLFFRAILHLQKN